MKIKLSKEFGNLIVTRKAIVDLFGKLSKISSPNITLDFEGVEFISRSAAHEYMRQKLASKANIKEVNLSKNVSAMFLFVAKQMQEREISKKVELARKFGKRMRF